jgi:ActR/RegA family two-component response regulator
VSSDKRKKLRNQSRDLSDKSSRLKSESEELIQRSKELMKTGQQLLPPKTVLVVDHNSPSLISLAKHLGGAAPKGELLMAHSQSGAIDMARQHQPDVAIVTSSLVPTGGSQLLPELIKGVSPETKIIIAKDTQAATAGKSSE